MRCAKGTSAGESARPGAQPETNALRGFARQEAPRSALARSASPRRPRRPSRCHSRTPSGPTKTPAFGDSVGFRHSTAGSRYSKDPVDSLAVVGVVRLARQSRRSPATSPTPTARRLRGPRCESRKNSMRAIFPSVIVYTPASGMSTSIPLSRPVATQRKRTTTRSPVVRRASISSRCSSPWLKEQEHSFKPSLIAVDALGIGPVGPVFHRDDNHVGVVDGLPTLPVPAVEVVKGARTISTFSCDIAYSRSPAASRAEALSGYSNE